MNKIKRGPGQPKKKPLDKKKFFSVGVTGKKLKILKPLIKEYAKKLDNEEEKKE